jgi:glycosyltransferase involved in cell wall biosynthesis
MACGIPVIITESCGIRSLVDGQAGLVIAPEKEALAEALRKLVYDRAVYARLKEGCHQVTGHLAWDRLAAQMEGYYAQALAGSNGIH